MHYNSNRVHRTSNRKSVTSWDMKALTTVAILIAYTFFRPERIALIRGDESDPVWMQLALGCLELSWYTAGVLACVAVPFAARNVFMESRVETPAVIDLIIMLIFLPLWIVGTLSAIG